MKKSLKIFSSSSLAFKSNVWKPFKKNYNFIYEEFIDLEVIKNTKLNSEINYFVIFIEDLIQELHINNHSNLNLIIKYIEQVSKKNKNKIIFSFIFRDETNSINFSTFENQKIIFLNKLKKKYMDLVSKNENLLYFDIDNFYKEEGYIKVFDQRNWYSFRLRLSTEGLRLLTTNLEIYLNKIFAHSKKVIIVDCDNTLWGGVIGEDGIENLKIGTDGEGKAHQDFQKGLKMLSENGIIICLVSKNNEADVWNVFKNHPEMILKKNDITTSLINWEEKSKNIEIISKKLNLSLDSFVFMDDNPIEREKVKTFLPDVEIINFDQDVSFWSSKILKLSCFANFQRTKEDKNKKKQYDNKLKFDEAKKKYKDSSKFLKSIKLNYKIEKLNKFHYARASQMTLKTNQFNFSTQRYSINEIKIFTQKTKNQCYILRVKDKYGDHGYVSLIMITEINKDQYLITNFLSSCRILGRNIEEVFLKEIVKKITRKYKKIFLEYKKSKKNMPAIDFINKNNLKKIKNSDKKKYKINQKLIIYQLKS